MIKLKNGNVIPAKAGIYSILFKKYKEDSRQFFSKISGMTNKKIQKLFLFIISLLLPVITFANVSDLNSTFTNTFWLPGFYEGNGIVKTENPTKFLFVIIKEVTKYVAIIAIIATMIGWLMFLFSAGSDEKVKKAKNVIIYSIIWVVVSIASFTLVDIINNLTLN